MTPEFQDWYYILQGSAFAENQEFILNKTSGQSAIKKQMLYHITKKKTPD